MEPLVCENHYHVFNRANGNDILFVNDENYHFFLRKYKLHISPIADTLAYCLMPNHFHFLVRFKNEGIIESLKNYKQGPSSAFLSKQFSNLFSSYTQAFNKQQKRKGSLFMKPFKRKLVTDDEYLKKLIHYIHSNPVASRLSNHPKKWDHSSYKSIISGKNNLLSVVEVLNYFETIENFIYVHNTEPKLSGIERF